MHPVFEKRQALQEWRRKPTLEIILRVEKMWWNMVNTLGLVCQKSR